MRSTKVEKKLFCGATVRLMPKNVLQNHLHLMVKKRKLLQVILHTKKRYRKFKKRWMS